MEIHLISFLLIICSLREIYCRKCLNEYRSVIGVIKYGRPASVYPDREVYYPEDVVRFQCPKGFYFESLHYRAHKVVWIKCLKDYRWLEHWPICRGPLENVTCENQYRTAESLGKHWLNQTVNEFHAIFSPNINRYPYHQILRFKCPQGSRIFRARGLTVMTTLCKADGEWTKEWPMCKGRTCNAIYVKNAIINDKNKKLSVGVTLDIKCRPGYYLWGPNRTTCLDTLEWSGYPQECVKLDKFRRNCEADKRVMKMKIANNHEQPYCYSEVIHHASNHHKIAVGISIPIAIGFVIFIIAASFYVKHQRVKMTRERASYIRQGDQHALLLSSLPTYDDVLKSKPNSAPPTFEETFAVYTRDHECDTSLPPVCVAHSTVIPVIHMVEAPPEYTEVLSIPSTSESPPHYTETSEISDLPREDTEYRSESERLDLPPENISNQVELERLDSPREDPENRMDLPPEYCENESVSETLDFRADNVVEESTVDDSGNGDLNSRASDV